MTTTTSQAYYIIRILSTIYRVRTTKNEIAKVTAQVQANNSSCSESPSDFRDTTGSTTDASLCKGSSDVLELVCCAVALGL